MSTGRRLNLCSSTRHDPRLIIGIIVLVVIIAIVVAIVVNQRREERRAPAQPLWLRVRSHRPRARLRTQLPRPPSPPAKSASSTSTSATSLPPNAIASSASGRVVQSRFVDHPRGSVIEADDLVASLMHARGYPVADFEQRAADISVNYPRVVENYRSAHAIALRLAGDEVTTEDMRTAMLQYRALFDELLQVSSSTTATRRSRLNLREPQRKQ